MGFSKLSRVDLQVSLLTAVLVLLSFFGVYLFNYTYTHRDMIVTLSERCTSIYRFLNDRLDRESFEQINSPADERKAPYRRTKALLKEAKQLTGVRYLYTAKRRADGSFVYVVDGLSSSSDDFRHAGDAIEPEIWRDMERALRGEIVWPEEIRDTDWGYIFISYFPVYDADEVVGVLGIEFEAGHQFKTFRMLQLGTPLIAMLTCLVAALVAIRVFRRISNPAFQDIATTDYLTKLKNRNAFEIDLHNLDQGARSGTIALISADLNDLKAVNDSQGHQAGDRYICAAANILRAAVAAGQILYRIGGDEFAVVTRTEPETAAAAVEHIAARIREEVLLANRTSEFPMYISLGAAVFDRERDGSLYETLKRADQQMYQDKRASKAQKGGGAK